MLLLKTPHVQTLTGHFSGSKMKPLLFLVTCHIGRIAWWL